MTDWIEIAALVAGPVAAVGLTLWREQVRHERERRFTVARQVLLARATPSDPVFTSAINLIPFEFGKDQKVMAAYEAFTHAANHGRLSTETEALAKAMLLSLGYSDRVAGQISRNQYMAKSLADQRTLPEGVLKGIVGLSVSSAKSAHAAAVMVEHVTGSPLPPVNDDSLV